LDRLHGAVRILQRGDQPQRREAARRDALRLEGLGAVQEVALEPLESDLQAMLELLDGFHLERDQRESAPREICRRALELCARLLRDVDLHVIHDLEERWIVELRRVVVERDTVAPSTQGPDRLNEPRSAR